MMRWGIFSDIHGNIRALREVLSAIEKENVDQIFCLGDLVGYGAHPNEVIELIKNRNIPTIMGNYDDGVAFDRSDCGCAYTSSVEKKLGEISLQWTKEKVQEDHREYLKTLKSSIRENLGPLEVLLVHGSPRRINEYLYAERPAERLLPMLRNSGAQVVVCGHTHLPYHRTVNGYHLINDGSVGKPKTGSPEAQYLILGYENELIVEHKTVFYDWDGAANDIIKAGLPEAFAQQVQSGGRKL